MRKNHFPAQALAPAPLPTPTPTPPPPLLSSFLQMKHHLHTLSRRYHQMKKSSQLRLNQPPQLILQPLCLSKMTSSPLKPRAKMTHRVHPHRPIPPTKRLPTIAHHLRMKSQIQQRHLRLLETWETEWFHLSLNRPNADACNFAPQWLWLGIRSRFLSMLKLTLTIPLAFLHAHVDPNFVPFFMTNMLLWYTLIFPLTYLQAQVDPNFVPFYDQPNAQTYPDAYSDPLCTNWFLHQCS